MVLDSFQQILNQVKRMIDDDHFRRRVLTLCQQTEPKSFEEYSSSGSFRKLEKFESSTYSEVLRAVDLADNNKPVVMKIMRALSKGVLKMFPSLTRKGCQSYSDIFNELVVSQALSQLHEGVLLNGQTGCLYRTHFFCLIHEIKVVSGSMEKTLSKSKQQAQSQTNERQPPEAQIASKSPQQQPAPQVPSDNLANTNQQLSSGSSLASGNTASQPSMNTQSTDLSSGFTPDAQKNIDSNILRATQNGSSTLVERDQQMSIDPERSSPAERKQKLEDADDRQAKKNNQEIEQNKDNLKVKSSQDDDDHLADDERMLMAALPNEYVVSVMRHDGQPLWWMMTHKKLSAEQLTSVLVQVIVGLAIAEHVYLYEHRDLHVSNILIKKTSNETIPFVVHGHNYQLVSHGIKATIIDATFSRLTHNGKVYFRDLTSTLRAYGARKTPPKMSLQNRSYRQMVRMTKNKWDEYNPKTNLIWLTYLCETLMKNEVMKNNAILTTEIKKIRDHTLRVRTTLDLLSCFPLEKARPSMSSLNKNT